MTEQRVIQERAQRLTGERIAPRAAEFDRTEEYTHENVRDLVNAGFTGLTIPMRYGGEGRPLLDLVLVVEEIAAACASTGHIAADANIDVVSALVHYGALQQQARCLPQIAAGKKPCICITEREADRQQQRWEAPYFRPWSRWLPG